MSTLNARFNQKFDTYANWQASSIILGKGEIAVVEIPGTQTDSGLTPPAIGVKIGNGTDPFSKLNWIQAIAGDVQDWAKAEKKPVYKAEEIEGIADFIAGEIQDTDTTYGFSYANNTLTVVSYQKGSDTPTTVAELPIDLSTKVDKVADAVEGNVVEFGAAGAVKDSGKKLSDYLTSATAASTYATQADFGTLEETVSGQGDRLGVAEGKLTTLIGADADKSVRTIANEELAAQLIKEGAAESLDTLQEIAQWIQDHPGDASEMNSKIAALEGTVGKAAEGDAEATGLVKGVADNAAAIAALEEASHTHSNQTVLDGITAEKVAAWDGAQAAAEATASAALALETKAREDADSALDGRVTTVEGLVGKTAEEGLRKSVADNASAISALEEKSHNHANQEVLDGVSAAKVLAWDAAVQSVSGLTTTKTGTDVAVTGVPVTLLKNVDQDTLVFNCGSASTVI